VSSLEWIWDRIAHRLDQADVDAIGSQLEELRVAADAEDTDAAAEAAPRFVESVAGLQLTG
jgi:DNA-binding GntR family transcriptional regulator